MPDKNGRVHGRVFATFKRRLKKKSTKKFVCVFYYYSVPTEMVHDTTLPGVSFNYEAVRTWSATGGQGVTSLQWGEAGRGAGKGKNRET